MPTLTASPAIKAAAAKRGLAPPSPTSAQKSPTANAPTSGPVAAPAEPRPSKGLTEKQREFFERQRQARESLLPVLQEVFPEVFKIPAPPLAIGIKEQILEVAGDSIDPKQLSAFLKFWCSRKPYRRAVWRGDWRVNLDGSRAGVPSIEHRNIAGKSLWGARHREIPEPPEISGGQAAPTPAEAEAA